jgi:formylglycine-generating enzyme required for sulfatase activity
MHCVDHAFRCHARPRKQTGRPGHRKFELQQCTGLANPANDARAIADLFHSAHFDEVKLHLNLGNADLRRAIGDFAESAADADIAVVYYAGHGIEMDGQNYLIPVDAKLTRDFDVDDEAFTLDRVLRAIEPARRLRLVILDACRDNPFIKTMKRSSASRSVGRGLARIEPGDTLVAFSAKAGSVALDGGGAGNSPFTAALLKHIATPGLDIRLAFGRVRDDVRAATKQKQEPFVYGSLGGQMVSIFGTPAEMPAPSTDNAAAEAWAATKDTTSVAVLEEFIRVFGNTPPYASLARARLDELRQSQVANVSPPIQTRPEPRPVAVSPPNVPQGISGPCEGRSVVIDAIPTPPCPPVQQAVVAPPVTPVVPPSEPCSGAVTVSFASRCAAPLMAVQERWLQPKDSFKECEKCPEMVVVPAGSFTMGSPKGEPGRNNDESPQHVVTIGKPFAVGRLHVTVDQFAAFVAETGYDAGSLCSTFEGGKVEERSDRSWRNPGFAQEGSRPAVCLNWNNAKAYVEWLANKTQKPYRMLTEAEWEYAARARTAPGTYPRFWFGNEEKGLCRYGNGVDQTARDGIESAKSWTVAPCHDGYAYTSPAGAFEANGFGLHDMFGNAWQWTADCYHDSYQGAPGDGLAWTAGDCSRCILRGGSWSSGPRELRPAIRNPITTVNRNASLGFRVGRTLTAGAGTIMVVPGAH